MIELFDRRDAILLIQQNTYGTAQGQEIYRQSKVCHLELCQLIVCAALLVGSFDCWVCILAVETKTEEETDHGT